MISMKKMKLPGLTCLRRQSPGESSDTHRARTHAHSNATQESVPCTIMINLSGEIVWQYDESINWQDAETEAFVRRFIAGNQ
jgi:hypothetical protein